MNGYVYKPINNNDKISGDFIVKKSWSISNSELINYTITGSQHPELSYREYTDNVGFREKLFYDTTNLLYYQTGSTITTHINPLIFTECSRSLGDKFLTISIPAEKYGEELDRGSVRILYPNINNLYVEDDGNGNLIAQNKYDGIVDNFFGLTSWAPISSSITNFIYNNGSLISNNSIHLETSSIHYVGYRYKLQTPIVSNPRTYSKVQFKMRATNFTGSVFVKAYSTEGIPVLFQPLTPFTGSNNREIVKNGNFTDGYNNWKFTSGSNLVSKSIGPNGGLEITSSSFADKISFYQSDFKMKKWGLYKISFDLYGVGTGIGSPLFSRFTVGSTDTGNQFITQIIPSTNTSYSYYIYNTLENSDLSFNLYQQTSRTYVSNLSIIEYNMLSSEFQDYQFIQYNASSSFYTGSIDTLEIGINCPAGITPNTLELKDFNYSASGSSIINNIKDYVGNVFYEHGNVIITNPTYLYSPYTDNMELEYASLVKLNEKAYLLKIDPSEFNYSLNSSAIKYNTGSNGQYYNTGVYLDEMVSGSLLPYITTVGLYNDDNELLMVGKFPYPIRQTDKFYTSILLKMNF